ncbi:MAG TPA: OmpA family protein [Burkholderiaceae bacterium]|nr:OmpA family protein [Burkholderiaceae bacterium]
MSVRKTKNLPRRRAASVPVGSAQPQLRELGSRYRLIGLGAAQLGLVAVLAACAGPEGPNPDIERARAEVNRVAAMPVVTQHAPLELKEAIDTVERGDREWREDGDTDEARHDAYLAEGRAAVAANYARARDADQQIERVKASADAQRLEARTREAEARLAEIEARQTERGLLVSLGDVLFETGRAELLPPAYPRLDRLAEFLRQHPDRHLLVEGYTDSVGSDSSNLALSERRANAVRMALLQRGVEPQRITTRGYGESYPVADNSNAEGRAMNRRVEVVITDAQGILRPRS